MWCDPADPSGPAEVMVVWEHPEEDCWCRDRRHVSWACVAHAPRERQDLRDLGFDVCAWVPTLQQLAPVLEATA
jgi:hypothetical protein